MARRNGVAGGARQACGGDGGRGGDGVARRARVAGAETGRAAVESGGRRETGWRGDGRGREQGGAWWRRPASQVGRAAWMVGGRGEVGDDEREGERGTSIYSCRLKLVQENCLLPLAR